MWFLHYAIKLVWLVFYSSSAIQQVSWLLLLPSTECISSSKYGIM
jgi:hypothetical protein